MTEFPLISEAGVNRFSQCVNNIDDRRCRLQGYPILDCPDCNLFRPRDEVAQKGGAE